MQYSANSQIKKGENRHNLYRQNPNDACRVPLQGTPLYTITIEDHVSMNSKRIVVKQSSTKNRVYTDLFGTVGKPVGFDKIMRRIRKFLVIRWLEV